MAASRIQPRHTDPVTLLDRRHPGADRRHQPDPLMPGRKRRYRLYRPVATGGMQVRVADATGLGLDQDFTRTRCGDREIADFERLAKGNDDGGIHGGHVGS